MLKLVPFDDGYAVVVKTIFDAELGKFVRTFHSVHIQVVEFESAVLVNVEYAESRACHLVVYAQRLCKPFGESGFAGAQIAA